MSESEKRMAREAIEERVAREIRATIDMVCDRDKIALDDDQRSEIACVAAADVWRDLVDLEEQFEPGDPTPRCDYLAKLAAK